MKNSLNLLRRSPAKHWMTSSLVGGALMVNAGLICPHGQDLTFDTMGMVKTMSINTVDVVGTTVYAGGNDLMILDVSDPLQQQTLSRIAMSGTASDIQVVGNHAFVAAGSYGLLVIDVSNPKNPVQAARYDTTDANTVQVVGTRAYLADGNGGMKIMDVSNPLNPRVLGIYDLASNAANAATVAGSRAYVTYGTKGLRVIDVSSASSPQLLGSIAIAKASQQAQVRPPFAYLAVDTVGLSVVNIADPARMEVVGTAAATDARRLELSGHYAYVADGIHGLRVFDISDPRQPKEAAVIPTERAVIDLRINGPAVYLATGVGGLTILQQAVAPEFIAHPQNQRIKAETSVVFNAEASGSPAPAYRWQVSNNQGITWRDSSDDAKVSGSATRSLVLNSVPEEWNQLWVRVQAINKVGNAFSLPAILTVDPKPIDPTLILGTPQLYAGFMIQGEVGKTYRIEFTDNLEASAWQLAEVIKQTENRQLWLDRSQPASGARFYRAVLQP